MTDCFGCLEIVLTNLKFKEEKVNVYSCSDIYDVLDNCYEAEIYFKGCKESVYYTNGQLYFNGFWINLPSGFNKYDLKTALKMIDVLVRDFIINEGDIIE